MKTINMAVLAILISFQGRADCEGVEAAYVAQSAKVQRLKEAGKTARAMAYRYYGTLSALRQGLGAPALWEIRDLTRKEKLDRGEKKRLQSLHERLKKLGDELGNALATHVCNEGFKSSSDQDGKAYCLSINGPQTDNAYKSKFLLHAEGKATFLSYYHVAGGLHNVTTISIHTLAIEKQDDLDKYAEQILMLNGIDPDLDLEDAVTILRGMDSRGECLQTDYASVNDGTRSSYNDGAGGTSGSGGNGAHGRSQ